MADVDLILCPYDLGQPDWRCGLGPARILQAGAEAQLAATGAGVRTTQIMAEVDYASETALVFEAQRRIAAAAQATCAAGRRPLVLGGNCLTAVGGIAGVGAEGLGLIWFDAHGDFNTPETSPSGFLDGMGLAMATGRCWRQVLTALPGHAAIPDPAVLLIGARDLDPGEALALQGSGIRRLSVADIRASGAAEALAPILDQLSRQVSRVYVHVDLDVLDPSAAPVNLYDAPDGLTLAELLQAIAAIGARLPIAGGGLGSYDPSVDPEGHAASAGVQVLLALSGETGPPLPISPRKTAASTATFDQSP